MTEVTKLEEYKGASSEKAGEVAFSKGSRGGKENNNRKIRGPINGSAERRLSREAGAGYGKVFYYG